MVIVAPAPVPPVPDRRIALPRTLTLSAMIVTSPASPDPPPLSGVVIDVWQANAKGRYDNDDPNKPPKAGVYRNRARLVTDENGFYEFESILPGRYLNGAQYRPAHIHYMVQTRGYRTLVTQLYFKGDPHNGSDPFIRKSLIIDLHERKATAGTYRSGAFDIVLAKG